MSRFIFEHKNDSFSIKDVFRECIISDLEEMCLYHTKFKDIFRKDTALIEILCF